MLDTLRDLGMWEEMGGDNRGGIRVYVQGCTEVAIFVKEVSGLKQMVEDMKETVAGLRLEDT